MRDFKIQSILEYFLYIITYHKNHITMGGHALKNTTISRISWDDYQKNQARLEDYFIKLYAY